MKKRSQIAKVLALCLAMVMMLSMSITSFAAITPDQTANIVVNDLDEGTTVTAYKVIDVNVNDNGQPEEPMYTWDPAVAEWLKTAGYDAYVDANGDVTETFTEGTAEAFKSFWHDLAAAIKDRTVTLATTALTAGPVAAGQTSATITGATMGQYLLTANGGVKIYQPTTVEANPAPYTFKLVFADKFIADNAGKKIYVTYTATVNENAFGTDALGNDAFLGYNNDPYDDSSFDEDGGKTEEDVYSYGVTLKKVDKNAKGLPGAEFTLSLADETLKFNGSNGVYTYDSKGNGTVTNLVVAADGTLSIKGLDEGTYTLKETHAPNGYVLPNGEITIEIADAEPDGIIDGQGSTIVTANGSAELYGDVSINGNIVSFNVQNTSSEDAGFQLPTTGGMGTMIFTIAGILIMAGAITMVVVISRKKRA